MRSDPTRRGFAAVAARIAWLGRRPFAEPLQEALAGGYRCGGSMDAGPSSAPLGGAGGRAGGRGTGVAGAGPERPRAIEPGTGALALLEAAHAHSTRNREALAEGGACGCFYCLRTFAAQEVKDWIHETTALCPHCGIDAVIPCAAVSVDSGFLGLMQAYWFKQTRRLALDVPAPGRRRLPRRRLCAREAASATACTDPAVEP